MVYIWAKEERRPSKASAPPGRKNRRLATLYYNHGGLKDTDRQPLGHLYLCVTHSTISSEVRPSHKWKHGPESKNLSPAMGRGIDSRNRVWDWVAKLHRLASRYDNPMPTWFLDPLRDSSYRHSIMDNGSCCLVQLLLKLLFHQSARPSFTLLPTFQQI